VLKIPEPVQEPFHGVEGRLVSRLPIPLPLIAAHTAIDPAHVKKKNGLVFRGSQTNARS